MPRRYTQQFIVKNQKVKQEPQDLFQHMCRIPLGSRVDSTLGHQKERGAIQLQGVTAEKEGEGFGAMLARCPSSFGGLGSLLPGALNGRDALRMLRGYIQGESRRPAEPTTAEREAFSMTDVGCERELNEDRFETVSAGRAITWIVCDGMGGVAGGEFAAQLAIDAMTRTLQQSSLGDQNVDALEAAFREANRVILLRRKNPEFSGMGTTAVAARFDGREVVVSSVGDSRAYLVREGVVQQLTVDDTYVQSLVDEGKLMAEDALSHPDAHVLTRCLGSEPSASARSERLWLWPSDDGVASDSMVLCTDGLYSLIPDAELGEIVSDLPPREACERLVSLARERGGYDNITLSIIPFPGVLRPAQPTPIAVNQGAVPSNRPARRGTGVLRHFMFLLLMAGLAAGATVAGFLAFKFLR